MVTNHDLSQLDNAALLVNLKRLAGSSNEITAHLLAHLAEVEVRGVYRELACSSLYTYCVYELRMSEDEAQRRCRAARAARQFPRLFDMLAEASIHLTGILLLAPHLTQENHAEVLGRARFRTKREIEKLVAELAPQPYARASVEPLGFAKRAPGGHSAMVDSLCGYVRELVAGDGRHEAPMGPIARGVLTADAMLGESIAGESSAGEALAVGFDEPASTSVGATQVAELERAQPEPEPAGSLAPMQYKVQFTADQAYVDLLEEARDLLQHEIPDRDLVRVQRCAMLALVEQLRRRKYAATARSRTAPSGATAAKASPPQGGSAANTELASLEPTAPERQSVAACTAVTAGDAANRSAPAPTRQEVAAHTAVTAGDAPSRSAPAPARQEVAACTPGAASGAASTSAPAPARQVDAASTPSAASPSSPFPASRHLAAAVKRAVWQRDQGRCAYVDSRGQRCRETAGIEFHHQRAYARGGGATIDNIALRCRAHNGLAAEQDFGREHIERKRARVPEG